MGSCGFRIAEVPARTRYFEEASSVGPWVSTVYGVKTLWAAGRLILHRTRLLPSRKFSPSDRGRTRLDIEGLGRRGRRRCCSPPPSLLSGGVLLNWLSDLTFWRDEWAFILDRRGSGIDTYLDPFVEQLLAIPVAIYKLLIAVFGIDSPTPFQIASTARLPGQRRRPVRLRPPPGGGVAGAGGGAAGPLPRPRLGRPAVPVPDRLLRLGRLRHRRPAGARPRGPPRRPDRLRAARDRALLLARRDPVRGRGDRRHRRSRASASGARSSS